MHYFQTKEIKDIILLIVAVLCYSLIYFIKDNYTIIRLYFGRKKSIVKLRLKGTEVVETRVRFVLQESPLDKKMYHVIVVHDTAYPLNRAKVYGEIDYMPMRASLKFKNGILVAVAVEDKKLYDLLLKDFTETCRRVLITSGGVIILWKVLLSRM